MNLLAKNDIDNINIKSVGFTEKVNGVDTLTDKVTLSAASTDGGVVDIAVTGGIQQGTALPGNVELQQLASTQNGRPDGVVALQAEGNITQAAGADSVKAGTLYLLSDKGGIGTVEQPLLIDTEAQTKIFGADGVSANAQNGIYLEETAGDLRVNSVRSETGDISLTAKGGLILDAKEGKNELATDDDTDRRIENWVNAGLIRGTDEQHEARMKELEGARDSYASALTETFDAYQQAKADFASAEAAYQEAHADYTNYETEAAKYADADESTLPSEFRTLQGAYTTETNLHNQLYADGATEYASASEYLNHDAKYQELADKAANPYLWTKEQMLYALNNAIINKEGGGSSETDVKNANITAVNGNVTLDAQGVGKNSNTETVITMAQLTGADGVDYMKQLASAQAADVTVVYEDPNAEQKVIKEFVIKGTEAVGVNASGVLNIRASGGDVYVAGRAQDTRLLDEDAEDATTHSALHIGTVETMGDVRLIGKKGIDNAHEVAVGATDTEANVKAHDLILVGGETNIGAVDKYFIDNVLYEKW